MLLALLLPACVLPSFIEESCDPRVLEPGEVRARQVLCSDELIGGGEARYGDWILENAVSRFAFRGTYSALYTLDEPGGTLLDAVQVLADGSSTEDVLGELRVEGDRSEIVAENGEGEARLVLPGMTWTLRADDPTLRLNALGEAVIQPLAGVTRIGTSWVGDGFFGVDGPPTEGTLPVVTTTLQAVTPSAEAWLQEGYGSAVAIAGLTTAQVVRVDLDGTVTQIVPNDGVFDGFAPAGAQLVGVSPGCTFRGLTVSVCGSMRVRVRDEAGDDIASAFTSGDQRWVLPAGGGSIPAGLEPLDGTLSAGPAYGTLPLAYTPDIGLTAGETHLVTLPREMDLEGVMLADLARFVAPDPAFAWTSPNAAHDATGDGIGYVVMLANDEIPTASIDPLDTLGPREAVEGQTAVLAVAGVRSTSNAGGTVISWPWTANGKRPAHGAPPSGLSPLDLLAVARDNHDNRRTLVDPAWVSAALAEAPAWSWPEAPLGIWLETLDDLDAYLDLLDSYVAVTPVGPLTWVELPTFDRNVPGVEAGLFAGRTTAGNGPRIEVHGGVIVGEFTLYKLEISAARRMGIRTVTVQTPALSQTYELEPHGDERLGGGSVVVRVRTGTAWAVAIVEGEEGTWGVCGVF